MKEQDSSNVNAAAEAAENGSAAAPNLEERLDRLEKYISSIAEPNMRRKDPSRSIYERAADRLESNAFSRMLITLGAVLAVFSFIGIAATAVGIRLQFQTMQEDKLARAWQSLATEGLGNAGKASALQLIHQRGEPLSGINIGGGSKLTSSDIPNLHLSYASISDSDWRYVNFEAIKLESTNFYRMSLDNLSLSGVLEDVEIVWSSAPESYFVLKSDSNLSIDTSVFDSSSFFIQAGREANGVLLGADLRVKEDGRVLIDTEEEEIQALRSAGEVVSFRNVSLRCALIPIEHTVNYAFESSNLSGAYIGSPYYYEGVPESAVANIGSEEWEKFKGAWYFSDNPPIGVPAEELAKNFVSLDREKIIHQCRQFEPRASEPNPLMLLDGADGIETTCVSLATHPEVCQPRYPSRQLYMVENADDPEFEL